MDSERANFRCRSCGAVTELEVPSGTVTLGSKHRPIDEQAPVCPCGKRRWVLVGSMTEYYGYSSRSDVCRVGDHIDARSRPVRLYPRIPPEGPGLHVLSLEVNVCPDHERELRTNGLLGFYLTDSE